MLKMDEVAQSFINQFHSLPGITVKEKHQNLFNLLHQNISLKQNPQVLDCVAENLEPKNHLEKILHVDFLIYFERFNELYEKFKKGEDITVRKVSKREWFFQKAFKEVGVEEFVDKILPSSSYSLKIKILRKLPVGEQKADEFFDAVCNRYGLFLATNLLQKCSSAKIREILSTQPIKATESQLKTIYKKDPQLICLYFDQRTKLDGNSFFMNNKPILIHIAEKNPKMFTELLDKYDFTIRIGRRTTKRYLNSEKDQVLESPEKYLKILNNAAVARKLGPVVVDSLVKKYTEDENFPWRSFLQHYQKNQRFKIYQKAHDAIFRICLADDVENMTEEDFDMMEDNEERALFAMKKIEKLDDDKYLKYVKPDYCLKTFMEKVNHMKSQERSNYVELATQCCILNKDYESFLKLAELVNVRFKNDEYEVRYSFFRHFNSNDKIMENFKEQHWKIVMEIFATAKAKSEWVWEESNLLANYLKFLVQNNKPIRELLEKDYSWFWVLHNDDFIKKNPKIFKPIMIEIIEIGKVKPNPDDALDAPGFDCRLASLCEKYNSCHDGDPINIFDHPRIKNSVKIMLEKETNVYLDDDITKGVTYMVCQLTDSEEVDEWKRQYFTGLKTFGRMKGIMWFLKHDPKSLQKNFDEFLKNFTEVRGLNPRRLWRCLKKYSHLELAERTVDFCRQHLREEFENKEKLARPLSMLATPSSHLQFILEFYAPTKDKVDLTNDEEKELYNLQGKLFKFLHYLNCPDEVVPVALSLCKGDYLKFALAPLYSSIYKLPENETKKFIEKLQESKAISVKKHALNLSCVIYDKETIFQSLEKTTVPYVTPTLKYFAKNPSSDLWNLSSKRINDMDKNELLALKRSLDIVLPLEYKTRFIELVWTILNKHESKDLKKTLLTKIDDGTLSTDFPVSIIKDSIFKLEEANDVVANFLVHVKTEEKFTLIEDIFTTYKNTIWDNNSTERSSRRKMSNFIQNLFEKYMEYKNHDQHFLQKFSTIFKSIFPLGEACQEWILLSLASFKKSTPESCATILTELNQLLSDNYGKHTINILATIINNIVFNHIFKTNGDKIKLCHALLKKEGTINDEILILKLLPKSEPKDKENYGAYKEIVEKLRQSKDAVVQLEFNLYLKDDPNDSQE